ncbi:unnamed protein product [Moneuplotes crassus]|uniref:Uncharacterized protein n=1 Tax=Euplotes crassus TaxID=5936 RepID=A0AAD1Y1Q0_EUPCR|nr:unnamed protein product [Moneuplotes crassus]
MNPLFSCCAYYCTGVSIVGIFFYSVILIFLATNNQYLLFQEEDKKTDRMIAVGIAMGLQAVCIVGYCTCLYFTKGKGEDEVQQRERPVFAAYNDEDE